MAKQMFLIPSTRLVRVEYHAQGVKYEATIDNPKSNAGLQVAMLRKGVGVSQIERVNPVQEYCRREVRACNPQSEHTSEMHCTRVTLGELTPIESLRD